MNTKEWGAIYLCIARGCGMETGRTPKKYCESHTTAESRKEVEAEWNARHKKKE